jgi:sugar lactone lactonase YvrE
MKVFSHSLTLEPTNEVVLNGDPAAFGVGVSGIGPFTYQWQFNGTNLPNNIISTVAGGGSNNPGNGGAATNAELSTLSGIAADNLGNYYIADSGICCIWKVDTNGIITTVAGNGLGGHSGDGGAATNANLNYPDSVAIDSQGNIYIAEYIGGCIRKVDTNGIITTVAGNGTSGYSGDGDQATNASLDYPEGIVSDSFGDLLIADTGNNRVREVGTNGIIMTFAGTNAVGFSGDGGPATNAYLNSPSGVAFDNSGDLLIVDSANNRVREVSTNGIITTVAGNGTNGYTGDGGAATNASLAGPYSVTVDGYGYMFIVDRGNNRVRQVDLNSIITTVAGNGQASYSGDGGAATNAGLDYPMGVAPQASGGLLIADEWDYRVREITLGRFPAFYQLTDVNNNNTGNYDVIITGPYGGSVTSSIVSLTVVYPPSISSQPQSIVVTNGSLAQFAVSASGTGTLTYQWCDGTNEVLDATNSTLIVSNATASEVGDYTCVITNAYGSITSSIAVLTVLISPSITMQPTKQMGTSGNSVTFRVSVAGMGPFTYQWQFNGTNLPNGKGIITALAATGGQTGYGGDGGVATNAVLFNPTGVAADSFGDIFIDDQGNNRIRMVNTNGIINTFAGIGPSAGSGSYSGDGEPANIAGLNLNNGTYPSGVAVDGSGNVYIADVGNERIRKVNTNGIIMTIAGTNTAGFSGDGEPAVSALLKTPTGLAVDACGDLFIADTGNNRIREINTNGIIMTVAGTNSAGFAGDGGPAVDAKLSAPVGVAVDAAGNLFIADMSNNRVRKVGPNGIITTFAGTNAAGFSGDGGAATNARLDKPYGVAVDAYDDIFIADDQNARVRMVNIQGTISTVAGDGIRGNSGNGEAATNAELYNASGVGVDSYGNLYVSITTYSSVRKVGFGGIPSLQLTNLATANAGSYDVIVTSPYGSVTSSIVSLNVFLSPAVVVQPYDVTASVGDPVSFNVTATNDPPFGYQWFVSSGRTSEAVPIVQAPSGMIIGAIILDPGAGYLSAPNVHFIDTKGSGATAGANVSSGGVTSITITFPGFNYSSGTTIQIDPPPIVAEPLPGETNATLTLPAIPNSGFTNYFVVITNAYGSVTSDIVAIFPPSTPKSFSIQNATNGFQFSFNGATPNYPYILESTTNLIPPIIWVPIVTNNAGNLSTWQYTDTNANGVQEYYKIVAQ